MQAIAQEGIERTSFGLGLDVERELPIAGDDRPEIDGILFGEGEGDTVESFHRADDGIAGGRGGLQLFNALVGEGGLFEIEAGGGAVASGGEGLDGALAGGFEEAGDALRLRRVFGGGHGALAGAKALIHFAINAAGVIGRRREGFFAAAQLKETADAFFVEFGGFACAKRAEAGGAQAAELV